MIFWPHIMDYIPQIIEELKLQKYRPETIRGYVRISKKLQNFLPDSVANANINQLQKFLNFLKHKKYSLHSIRVAINAINFIYTQVFKFSNFTRLKNIPPTQKQPVILNPEEIQLIIRQTKNFKHKTIIHLAYGSGLTIGEILNLKVKDFDFETPQIYIRKGKKERKTILPENLIEDIWMLKSGEKTDDFIFTSERGSRLASSTVQKIFKKCLQKAEIKKPATFQSLRDSFAVHLLESGVGLEIIQELLGHKHIRVTKKYTDLVELNLKNIKSPLKIYD